MSKLYMLAFVYIKILRVGESELLQKPQNVIIASVEEEVKLTCSTNYTEDKVNWRRKDTSTSDFDESINPIVQAGQVWPDYLDRYSIINETKEDFHLVIKNVTWKDAGTYRCIDHGGFGKYADGELIVIGNLTCKINHSPGSKLIDGLIEVCDLELPVDDIIVNCTFVYRGNVPPNITFKTSFHKRREKRCPLERHVTNWQEDDTGDRTTGLLVRSVLQIPASRLVHGETITVQVLFFHWTTLRNYESLIWTSHKMEMLYARIRSKSSSTGCTDEPRDCFETNIDNCSFKWLPVQSQYVCQATCQLREAVCEFNASTAIKCSGSTTFTQFLSVIELIFNDYLWAVFCVVVFAILLCIGRALLRWLCGRGYMKLPNDSNSSADESEEFQMETELLFHSPLKNRVYGITELRGTYYAIYFDFRYIIQLDEDGRDIESYNRIRIDGIHKPMDLQSCQTKSCLYITCSDPISLWRVTVSDSKLHILERLDEADKYLGSPFKVYITLTGKVLMVGREPRPCLKLLTFDDRDVTVDTVDIQDNSSGLNIKFPEHAVKMSDKFVVSFGGNEEGTSIEHFVCIVDKHGTIERTYSPELLRSSEAIASSLDRPYYLATDEGGRIFVTDYGHSRVIALTKDLKFLKVVSSWYDELKNISEARGPGRLYYVRNRNVLLVGWGSGREHKEAIGAISAYTINPDSR